jgi:hypothetical protein
LSNHRTWLQYTEQRRHTKAVLAAARTALQQLRLRRLLAAWQQASDALAVRQQQRSAAAQHYELRLKQRLLLQWRENAEDLAFERQMDAAADVQYRRHLLFDAVQGWSWFCW